MSKTLPVERMMLEHCAFMSSYLRSKGYTKFLSKTLPNSKPSIDKLIPLYLTLFSKYINVLFSTYNLNTGKVIYSSKNSSVQSLTDNTYNIVCLWSELVFKVKPAKGYIFDKKGNYIPRSNVTMHDNTDLRNTYKKHMKNITLTYNYTSSTAPAENIMPLHSFFSSMNSDDKCNFTKDLQEVLSGSGFDSNYVQDSSLTEELLKCLDFFRYNHVSSIVRDLGYSTVLIKAVLSSAYSPYVNDLLNENTPYFNRRLSSFNMVLPCLNYPQIGLNTPNKDDGKSTPFIFPVSNEYLHNFLIKHALLLTRYLEKGISVNDVMSNATLEYCKHPIIDREIKDYKELGTMWKMNYCER